MKKGLISKILSGGLAAAMVFSVFSPSVFADRDRSLYYALDDEEPSIEKLERVLATHDYNYYVDYYHGHVWFAPLLSALRDKCSLDILKWLFDHEKTILQNPENGEYRDKILGEVIFTKNLPFLEFLFDTGAISKEDLDRPNDSVRTFLDDAAYYDWLEGAQLLYKNGASVDLRRMLGSTPVYTAARSGHVDVVRFLVDECHADFNIINAEGYTAVSIAATYGQLGVVKWFIESGYVGLDYMDGNGRSLLKAAKTQEVGVAPEQPEKTAAVVAYLESKGAVE